MCVCIYMIVLLESLTILLEYKRSTVCVSALILSLNLESL